MLRVPPGEAHLTLIDPLVDKLTTLPGCQAPSDLYTKTHSFLVNLVADAAANAASIIPFAMHTTLTDLNETLTGWAENGFHKRKID